MVNKFRLALTIFFGILIFLFFSGLFPINLQKASSQSKEITHTLRVYTQCENEDTLLEVEDSGIFQCCDDYDFDNHSCLRPRKKFSDL